MFSLNSLNSVRKKVNNQKRADPYTEPNSCFSDSSDSLNLLNSLNSMKVLLHLEKTPMSLNRDSSFALKMETDSEGVLFKNIKPTTSRNKAITKRKRREM